MLKTELGCVQLTQRETALPYTSYSEGGHGSHFGLASLICADLLRRFRRPGYTRWNSAPVSLPVPTFCTLTQAKKNRNGKQFCIGGTSFNIDPCQSGLHVPQYLVVDGVFDVDIASVSRQSPTKCLHRIGIDQGTF